MVWDLVRRAVQLQEAPEEEEEGEEEAVRAACNTLALPTAAFPFDFPFPRAIGGRRLQSSAESL